MRSYLQSLVHRREATQNRHKPMRALLRLPDGLPRQCNRIPPYPQNHAETSRCHRHRAAAFCRHRLFRSNWRHCGKSAKRHERNRQNGRQQRFSSFTSNSNHTARRRKPRFFLVALHGMSTVCKQMPARHSATRYFRIRLAACIQTLSRL